MFTFIVAILLLVALYPAWKVYRTQPGTGRIMLGVLAVLLLALAGYRLATGNKVETPIIARGVHEAGGYGLGRLVVNELNNGETVIVLRPNFDHPMRRQIATSQIEGIKLAAREKKLKIVEVEFDVYRDLYAVPSQPVVTEEDLRGFLAGTPEAKAFISLCGAPVCDASTNAAGLPPYFCLNWTEPKHLFHAFRSGLLRGTVSVKDLGQDLDLKKLTMDEVFNHTYEVVTISDAQSGKIEWFRRP